MAAKGAKNQSRSTVPHGRIVGVQTKEHHRRPVPKTYSYRYEVSGDAGPDDQPLVRAGAVIIESRYRGRGATWNISRSVADPTTYLVRGGYVHPLEENPMAYPPREFAPSDSAAARTPTPGFAAPKPPPAPAGKHAAPPAPTQIRRGAIVRPTSANETVFKKTG